MMIVCKWREKIYLLFSFHWEEKEITLMDIGRNFWKAKYKTVPGLFSLYLLCVDYLGLTSFIEKLLQYIF